MRSYLRGSWVRVGTPSCPTSVQNLAMFGVFEYGIAALWSLGSVCDVIITVNFGSPLRGVRTSINDDKNAQVEPKQVAERWEQGKAEGRLCSNTIDLDQRIRRLEMDLRAENKDSRK